MEVDIMVRQVQLLSRACIALVLGFSCNNLVQYPHVLKSSKEVNTFNKLVKYKGEVFTGYLYEMHPESKDTMFVNFYNAGEKDGVWRKLYPSGKLKEIRYYKKGIKEGKYIGFFRNGNKSFEYNFRNGEYNGEYKVWRADKMLLRVSNYKNGYEHGQQKIWNPDGRIKSNYIIKNGRRYGLLGIKNCINVSDSIIN